MLGRRKIIANKEKSEVEGQELKVDSSRGRCYEHIPGESKPPATKFKAKPKASLVGMRVIRANGDIEIIDLTKPED